MMSSPFLAKVSGLSIAFLALAFTSGVSMVRAQTDVPSWMLADPISDAVKALEARVASLEEKVASVAPSLTSRQARNISSASPTMPASAYASARRSSIGYSK
jgi:hypothetical protein